MNVEMEKVILFTFKCIYLPIFDLRHVTCSVAVHLNMLCVNSMTPYVRVCSGELGWELYIDQKNMATVYQAIMEAGKDEGIDHFGTYAMSSLRLEKGFRGWGAEVHIHTHPGWKELQKKKKRIKTVYIRSTVTLIKILDKSKITGVKKYSSKSKT